MEYSERQLTKAIGLPRNAIHRDKNYVEPQTKIEKQKVINTIMQIYQQSGRKYGAPKIHAELKRKHNINVSLGTIQNYMRECKIISCVCKKFKYNNKKSKESVSLRKNLLRKQCVVRPRTHFLTDITYIWTISDGWCYLCSFMDVYTRRISSWSLSTTMDSNFVDSATAKLISSNPDIQMIHSDQGSQYTSNSYTDMLNGNGILISYSRKGYPYHNAWIESYHGLMKKECIYESIIFDFEDLENLVMDYLDGFYNTTRIHSALDYYSPDEFEEIYHTKKLLKELNINIKKGKFGIYYYDDVFVEFK